MKYEPHGYQQRAIKFMLERPCGGLFMDPGLGKTSITLAAASILLEKKLVKHLLVVAPLRVVYSVWPQEVEKWDQFRHLSVGIMHGPKKHKILDEDYDIYLMNPEGLLWLRDTGRYKEFDGLVVDECFVGGTLVQTSRGEVPIESVRVGDRVLTIDGWRGVLNTFEGCAAATVLVSLSNGKSFECTPSHEVWTQEAGWVEATNLCDYTLVDVPRVRGLPQSNREAVAGQAQGSLVAGPRVESVAHLQRHGAKPVYDLQIEGAHEYTVAGVRVHNSTKFKHTNTRRFKAMRAMIPHFDRRYILTGTPAPNGLIDLFGQIYLLDGGEALGRYVSHYRANYFEQIDSGYLWVPRAGAKKEVYDKIAPLVMRLDQHDYLEMPHRKVTDIVVDLPEKAMKSYKELETTFVTKLQAGEIVASNAAVASHKLRQIASGGVYVEDADGKRTAEHMHDAKTEACKDLVEQFQGQPTVIAYDTHHDLDRLRKAFGKDLPYIGGGVSATRGNDLASLWNQGRLPVLALHPASAAHGLNLQHGGCHCIWYTLTWDLEQYDQLIRRVWRQGQERNVVFIYHIIARGTMDHVVAKRLITKDTEQRSLLDSLREYYLEPGVVDAQK